MCKTSKAPWALVCWIKKANSWWKQKTGKQFLDDRVRNTHCGWIGWINFDPEQQDMWAERKSIPINLYCNCMSGMNFRVFFVGRTYGFTTFCERTGRAWIFWTVFLCLEFIEPFSTQPLLNWSSLIFDRNYKEIFENILMWLCPH